MWWTEFKDPQLNSHIDSALSGNFTIKTAWERINAAKALYSRQRSSLQPVVDTELEASDRRGGTLLNKNASEYGFSITTSYEIDLWGRIKSSADAELFRIKATEAEMQSAALSVAAEVALTWFQIIEARSQIKVLNEQIQTNTKALQLLENRFKAGQIRHADVLRQKSLIESNKEQIIVVESRIETLENLLAVLQGKSPQEVNGSGKDKEIPVLPPLPDAGVPADLVNRRPDVSTAYNLILSANRDLASAIADQYPRLSLSAALTSVAGDPSELFRQWIRSVAASLITPVYDGGERQSEIKRNEAIQRQRLNEYSQTVLIAFREVEDALVREKKQITRIANLEQQLKLAEQTHQLLETEYFNGIGNFLDLLEALTDVQQISREIITAKLTLTEYRISLYKALAGNLDLKKHGFKNE